MKETDPHLADLEDIVALVGHEVCAPDPRGALDPRCLVSMYVDRDLDQFEELAMPTISWPNRSPPTWSEW